MSRRQASRAQEEPIPEELIASIPVVGDEPPTEFVPVDDSVILVAPPSSADAAPQGPGQGADAVGQTTTMEQGTAGAALAAQLRYDLGEAFARELDKAESAIASAIGDLEKRLVLAEAALVRAHEAVEREREGREQAEARLRAFKELAMK